jgi:curved DNA-binding protein CbpA
MKSHYELLGASADADAEALKKAFRKAVKAHHPDLHPNDPDALERFREIIAANALLRDPKQRATYDWLLQVERECFQLTLKRQQRRSTLVRQQLRSKRTHTIAVIAAISLLIGGYGLWGTMPKSGNGEIKDELAAAAGGAVEKQTATVLAAAKENENPSAAIGAAKADAVKGDNSDQPGEPVGAVRMQPANLADQDEQRYNHDSAEVPNGASETNSGATRDIAERGLALYPCRTTPMLIKRGESRRTAVAIFRKQSPVSMRQSCSIRMTRKLTISAATPGTKWASSRLLSLIMTRRYASIRATRPYFMTGLSCGNAKGSLTGH